MIVFTVTGCGSTDEFSKSEEPQSESSAETMNEEIVEENLEDLNSVVTDQSEMEMEDRQISEAERALEMRFQREANTITHLYVTAQQLFYNGNSKQALLLIQQANEIRDNADIRALKGSIYLSLGNRDKFEENWRKAFELDTEVPIPSIPVIKKELQNLGLID